MLQLDLSGVQLKLRHAEERTSVFDPVRRKWLILTPEEHVRQHILHYLMHALHYPPALIAVEKTIAVGPVKKRFDIVVYGRDHKPWMLVECKAPEIQVNEKTLQQLLNYQRTIQCSYWLLTNGHKFFCADACNIQDIKWLNSLPAYQL